MTHIVDTQLLLWAIYQKDRLSGRALAVLTDPTARLTFSAVSVLEVAIKTARGREDFDVSPDEFVSLLLEAGYRPLDVTPAHAARVVRLPALHGDPFDRLLLAQAEAEGLALLTADRTLARYGGPVRLV